METNCGTNKQLSVNCFVLSFSENYTHINMPANNGKIGNLPINLMRKIVRERRHTEDRKVPKKRRRRKKQPDPERQEHESLVEATLLELRELLENDPDMSDIPFDCTPEELEGEIAIMKGFATTIVVERDGLSDLNIVLAQEEPTIGQLKRAIESAARVQLQRELREREEERLRRRFNIEVKIVKPLLSTGELVHSAARCGHKHRSRVSWRFLWRAYCLFNVDKNVPINDENGRQLLSACGIENGTKLKFIRRDIYFKRKRQN